MPDESKKKLKFRKKKKPTDNTPVDLYGTPIIANIVNNPNLEGSYYDSRLNQIMLGKDYDEMDDYGKERVIAHENFHAGQYKKGYSTLLPRRTTYKEPSMVTNDETYYAYHNRKFQETQDMIDEFKSENKSFNFVPDDIVYNNVVRGEQYYNSSTMEGEAKFYEDLGADISDNNQAIRDSKTQYKYGGSMLDKSKKLNKVKRGFLEGKPTKKLYPDGGKIKSIYTDEEIQRIIESQQRTKKYASGNTEMPLDEIIPSILLARGFGVSQQTGMKYSPSKFQDVPDNVDSPNPPLLVNNKGALLPRVRKSKLTEYKYGGNLMKKFKKKYAGGGLILSAAQAGGKVNDFAFDFANDQFQNQTGLSNDEMDIVNRYSNKTKGLPFGIGTAVGAIGDTMNMVTGRTNQRLNDFRIQKAEDDFTNLQQANKMSGYLDQSKVTFAMGGDLQEFEGPVHEEGGIQLTPEAEVEGGETKKGNYIFSDRLKVPGKKRTFAQLSKDIKKKYTGKRPNDPIDMKAEERELATLQDMQETVRGEIMSDAYMMAYGGFLKKKKMAIGGNMPGPGGDPNSLDYIINTSNFMYSNEFPSYWDKNKAELYENEFDNGFGLSNKRFSQSENISDFDRTLGNLKQSEKSTFLSKNPDGTVCYEINGQKVCGPVGEIQAMLNNRNKTYQPEIVADVYQNTTGDFTPYNYNNFPGISSSIETPMNIPDISNSNNLDKIKKAYQSHFRNRPNSVPNLPEKEIGPLEPMTSLNLQNLKQPNLGTVDIIEPEPSASDIYTKAKVDDSSVFGMQDSDYLSAGVQSLAGLSQLYYGLQGPDEIPRARLNLARPNRVNMTPAKRLASQEIDLGYNAVDASIRDNAPSSGSYLSNRITSAIKRARSKGETLAKLSQEEELQNASIMNNFNQFNAGVLNQEEQLNLAQRDKEIAELDASRMAVTEGLNNIGQSVGQTTRDKRAYDWQKVLAKNWMGTDNIGTDVKGNKYYKSKNGNFYIDGSPVPKELIG